VTENPSVPDFESLAETFGGILERLVPQGRTAEIEEALRFRQVGGLQRLGFFALRDALAAAPHGCCPPILVAFPAVTATAIAITIATMRGS
jgi:hypothetical protein